MILLSGCVTDSVTYEVDKRLPPLKGIKHIPSNTSVGFEWQPVSKMKLDGVNIYRSEASKYSMPSSSIKELTKIATVSNPFASHFVDTNLQQNRYYLYTFTTIKGDRESLHGDIVEIKTLPPLPKITFFKGIQKTDNTIKIIWRPHQDKRIDLYKIQRSMNGGEWEWIGEVKHRMMAEFIDNDIVSGNQYRYRVIAVGFDGSYSLPSNILTIMTR